MKCKEVLELIQRELDHDLEDEEQNDLQKHLSSCSQCHQQYHRLHAVSSSLETLPKVNPPINIVDSILPELEKMNETEWHNDSKKDFKLHRSNWKKKRWWIPGSVVAAGLLALLINLNSLSSYEQADDSTGTMEIASNIEEQANTTSDNAPSHSDMDTATESADVVYEERAPESPEEERMIGLLRETENQEEAQPNETESQRETDSPGIQQMTGGSDEEVPIMYESPSGLYTAHEGYNGEDIRIDKDGQPHYLPKIEWEAPWIIHTIEWLSDQELYIVLHHPEEDEYEYWKVYVEKLMEENMPGPVHHSGLSGDE